MVNSVRNANGDVVLDFKPEKPTVLDPRVAFVMTNMMEGVINFGTAFAVRARGFTAPAAGKTGSSHDGWFAGYTSNLLCIVWVGYDDYSDMRLSGAQTAAPIWAEFMKKAVALPQYSDMQAVLRSRPAWSTCSWIRPPTGWQRPPVRRLHAAFIAGTEPQRDLRPEHGNAWFLQSGLWFRRGQGPSPTASRSPAGGAWDPRQFHGRRPQQKKKGFFGKIAGIFKDDKPSNDPPAKPADTGGNGNSPQ